LNLPIQYKLKRSEVLFGTTRIQQSNMAIQHSSAISDRMAKEGKYPR